VQLIHTLYEPAGTGPHPTILTLHGRGANAFDLLGLAPHLCGGKFLMICPQGPLETPIGPDAVGYAWFPMSMGGPPDVAAILSSQNYCWRFSITCATIHRRKNWWCSDSARAV
jgi:predicted esterase